MAQTQQNAVPKIDKIDHRIATLERREEYLSKKLESSWYAERPAAEFDRSEVEALKAAVVALKYVRDQAKVVTS